MKKYYMHCILCSARRTVLYIRDVCSTTCWNNLQDLWERSPRFVGIWARKKISKICWNNLQDLWECGREKKIPKICGRDFLAYTREKKSTRFVGEIFTRFSSLSPRKKISKICGIIFSVLKSTRFVAHISCWFFFYKKSGFIPKIPTFLVREIAKSR